MRILGIDPGSLVVGYACVTVPARLPVSVKNISINDAGVMRAPAKKSHAQRIGMLHEALYALISKHEPHILVIEKAFTGINMSSALKLGEARGALITAAQRHRLDVSEITPSQVKKSIVGNGQATKEQVSETLRILCGFDRGSLPFDATDALAIALTFGLSVR
jgi:crossover junction endodeoxyribonuclease RuvC